MCSSFVDGTLQQDLYQKKNMALQWFDHLKTRFCSVLEEIENEHCPPENKAPKFKTKLWKKETGRHGSGVLEQLKGNIFEKAIIHNSNMYGSLDPQNHNEQSHWNVCFYGMIYPRNPHIPALSMQFHMVVTDYIWFSFAIEIIPMLARRRQNNDLDVIRFQKLLQLVCKKYMSEFHYDQFVRRAEKIFLIPHRGVQRGCAGLFGEQISSSVEDGGWSKDFSFIEDLGKTLCVAYPRFVQDNLNKPWQDTEKLEQLLFRGLCAEYILSCDSYARFALNNEHNANAVLAGLPPVCHWG